MRKILIVLAAFLLTGCAFHPGTPMFDAVALHYDRQDPCQAGTTPERRAQLGRPEGYQRPGWCGSGGSVQRANIYNTQGQRIGQIRY